MKYSLPIFTVLAILCAVMLGRAEPGVFDFPVDKTKMMQGEPQIFERHMTGEGKKKKRRIAGIVLINASPDEVWHVMNDWKSMDQFVPDLDYYRVISEGKRHENENMSQLFVEGRLNIPLFNFIYNLDVVSDKSRFLQTWRLMTPEEVEIIRLVGVEVKDSTDGIEEIDGYACLEPVDNGRKSIYTYSTVIEFSMPVPEFVENYICRNALAGFMEGVKKRAESHGLYIKDSFSLFSD